MTPDEQRLQSCFHEIDGLIFGGAPSWLQMSRFGRMRSNASYHFHNIHHIRPNQSERFVQFDYETSTGTKTVECGHGMDGYGLDPEDTARLVKHLREGLAQEAS